MIKVQKSRTTGPGLYGLGNESSLVKVRKGCFQFLTVTKLLMHEIHFKNLLLLGGSQKQNKRCLPSVAWKAHLLEASKILWIRARASGE